MIAKNDLIELEIAAISSEGSGIGRYTDETLTNFVIYVPFVAVGDVIECRVLKVLSSYAYGKCEKIITPSKARIEPECKAFGKCGGCAYCHLNYAEELRVKRETVVGAYKSVFGKNAPNVNETVPSPEEKGYRNKVQFPITADGKCGFFAPHSHRLVDIDGCMLQDKAFAPIVKTFEEYVKKSGASVYGEESGKGLLRHLYLRRGTGTDEICVCIVANGERLPGEDILCDMMFEHPAVKSLYLNTNTADTNVILGDKYRLIKGEKYINDRLCGISVRISPQSFYQINKAQAERLYSFGVKLADIKADDNVLDLYCGIGGIADICARYAKRVAGVEIVPEAIEDAKRIAKDNGIGNAEFYASDANRLAAVLSDAGFVPDTVFVDPPRKGLDEKTVSALAKIAPKKIVYISCNPSSQAKNVRDILSEAERSGAEYTVSDVTPFDMFPRTSHVESVVLLSRAYGETIGRLSE